MFNIGDKVVVTQIIDENELEDMQEFINATATIIDIDADHPYPYTLLFDDEYLATIDNFRWAEHELRFFNEKAQFRSRLLQAIK
jgi:hypothetical protein